MVYISFISPCIYWQWPYPLNKVQPFVVIASCVLVNLSIGTFFAIGNLLPYVVSYVRVHSSPSDMRMNVAAYVYAIQLTGIGCAIMLGSLLEKKIGPRLVVLLGGSLMIAGAATSYYTIKISFWFFVFSFGLVNGVGIGIAYVSPIACAMKWLPKWKGLVSGIVVSGIGLSPLVFNAIQTGYINPHNLTPKHTPYPKSPDEKYFIQEQLLEKVPNFFLILGLCYLIIIVLGSICIANPVPTALSVDPTPQPAEKVVEEGAENQVDETIALINAEKKKTQEVPNLNPIQMCKTLNFYLLLFMFTTGLIIASFFAPLYKSFGLEQVTTDDHFITIAGSIGAIFNLLGRILWPLFADLTTYKDALVFLGGFMTFFLSTLLITTAVYKAMYFIWVCAIFFAIGGYMSIFPTCAVQSYGPKDVSLNYGILASISLIIGSLSAGFIAQMLVRTIDWYGTFFVLTGLSFLNLLVPLLYRHKVYGAKK